MRTPETSPRSDNRARHSEMVCRTVRGTAGTESPLGCDRKPISALSFNQTLLELMPLWHDTRFPEDCSARDPSLDLEVKEFRLHPECSCKCFSQARSRKKRSVAAAEAWLLVSEPRPELGCHRRARRLRRRQEFMSHMRDETVDNVPDPHRHHTP